MRAKPNSTRLLSTAELVRIVSPLQRTCTASLSVLLCRQEYTPTVCVNTSTPRTLADRTYCSPSLTPHSNSRRSNQRVKCHCIDMAGLFKQHSLVRGCHAVSASPSRESRMLEDAASGMSAIILAVFAAGWSPLLPVRAPSKHGARYHAASRTVRALWGATSRAASYGAADCCRQKKAPACAVIRGKLIWGLLKPGVNFCQGSRRRVSRGCVRPNRLRRSHF